MEVNEYHPDGQEQDRPQRRLRLINPWGGRTIVLVVILAAVLLFLCAWTPE